VATFRATVQRHLDDILYSAFKEADLVLIEGDRSGAYP
jgi:hypothetical protein